MSEQLPIETLLPLLQALVTSKNSKFKILIKHLHPDSVKHLCEFSLNLVKGLIKITEADLKTARGYKPFYKILASKRNSLKTKHNCLAENPAFAKSFFKLIIKTFDVSE